MTDKRGPGRPTVGDGPTRQLTLRIPENLVPKLRAEAAIRGLKYRGDWNLGGAARALVLEGLKK